MNSIFDPSILFISQSDWDNETKREQFLSVLLNNLKNIDEYDITRIYWTGRLDLLLWESPQLPPWRINTDWSNKLVPIIYNRFSKRTELINIADIGECNVSPSLKYDYGKEEINNNFMKLVHTLIDRSEDVYLCLSLGNKQSRGRVYIFSCSEDCHPARQLIPTLINKPADWFNYIPDDLDTNNWNHYENYFPRKEFSDQLADNKWAEFRDELKTYSPNARLAKIEEIGSLVAKINGYKYNPTLSSYNQRKKGSKRVIFQAGLSRKTIYLSIDFEKGAFEVCNFTGKWLGEFGFHGRELSSKDDRKKDKGKHDILFP